MFLLKKLISNLLLPVPLVLLLGLVGLVWLYRNPSSRWPRRILVSAFILLALCAFRPLPYLLVTSLEHRYEDHHVGADGDTLEVGWIVVLGGGVAPDPDLPPNDQLYEASLARVVEAVRLASAYPEARVLFSGAAAYGTSSEADVMAQTAQQLGIDSTRCVRDNTSRDTASQARTLTTMAGDTPVLLVTSAIHMPRSLALFRKQGLDPIPAPTGRLMKRSLPFRYIDLYPSSDNMRKLNRAWHEYLGLAWSKLRGQI